MNHLRKYGLHCRTRSATSSAASRSPLAPHFSLMTDVEMDDRESTAGSQEPVDEKDKPENTTENGQENESDHNDAEEEDIPDEPVDPEEVAAQTEAMAADAEIDEVLQPFLERRDRSLKEMLEAMNDYAPIIPDAVTDYYLARAGFQTRDHRIKRLLALATQKFVSDIAADAYQFSRIRSQSGISNPARRGTANKAVLTMEDLSNVLTEYGINTKRPDFYR